jgi:uroporphyrin-III C-methyltransferase/precorrin-2 dehydrogenase/sirohydrochlorin ferrochelatase
MSLFPLFVDIKNKPCLVVGGGKIAARKLKMLCHSGAHVTLVAPHSCDATTALCDQYNVLVEQRNFVDSDIHEQRLVIAATDSPTINQHISALAQAQNIFVNVASDFTQGDTVLPSVIDRDPIQIAVTTGGASPVLARLLKSNLERATPTAYGQLATLVENYRALAISSITDEDTRRRFWEEVLQGPIAEMVFAGQILEAEKTLKLKLENKQVDGAGVGEVYLVGAGPGDPDLLTFRALRLMQQADAVVYDRLVSDEIMNLVRKDAEMVYAGKERANHAIPQESINHLLVRLAKQGKRVLRLKGGDPFIFGRGGEEIETLMEEGVHFQVVPGITAAAGCASYAGIPLTHRDHAQACIFVTGHLRDGTVNLNWNMLAHASQTLVFYMGLVGLEIICQKLTQHGMPDDTPAALVSKGTRPDQRVLIGDLSNLPELVKSHDVHGPTLIIVGSVVTLHSKLHWYLTEREFKAD